MVFVAPCRRDMSHFGRTSLVIEDTSVRFADYLAVDGVNGVLVRAIERTEDGRPSDLLWSIAYAAHFLDLEAARVEPGAAAPELELRAERLHGRIRFVGAIEGSLKAPLVEVLRALSSGRPEYASPMTHRLMRAIRGMRDVRVFASPTSEDCQVVVAAALRLACASPKVNVTVIRVDAATDGSERVETVPTVVCNDSIIVTSRIGESDLAELVARC